MIRHAFALLSLIVLTAWTERHEVPYHHPANPSARSASPIAVPRIQAPNVEDVTPDPAKEETRSPRERPRSPPGAGAPAHQHRH
jgi:hypothetical protein